MDYGRRTDSHADTYGSGGGGGGGNRDRRDRERPDRGGTRYNEYFLPGEGISREVIQADICRYLGNDALVRPGTYEGRSGYLIKAYRNLTSEMISDLKADSARWEAERRQALSQQDPRDPRRYQGKIGLEALGAIQHPDSNAVPQYVNSATYEDSTANQYERQHSVGTPQPAYQDSGYGSRREPFDDPPQIQSGGMYSQQQMPQTYPNYAPTTQSGYSQGMTTQYQYEGGQDAYHPRTQDYGRGTVPQMNQGINQGYGIPQQQPYVTAPPGMYPQTSHAADSRTVQSAYADPRYDSRHAPSSRESHGRRHR